MPDLGRSQARRVVPAGLHVPRSERSGAIVVAVDQHLDRIEPFLIVRTYRSNENDQQVFPGGFTPTCGPVPNSTGRIYSEAPVP